MTNDPIMLSFPREKALYIGALTRHLQVFVPAAWGSKVDCWEYDTSTAYKTATEVILRYGTTCGKDCRVSEAIAKRIDAVADKLMAFTPAPRYINDYQETPGLAVDTPPVFVLTVNYAEFSPLFGRTAVFKAISFRDRGGSTEARTLGNNTLKIAGVGLDDGFVVICRTESALNKYRQLLSDYAKQCEGKN